MSARHVPREIRSISLLMPTFQGEAFLERVMAALASQRCELEWDFLAIDSGSTDRTLAILDAWKSRFPAPLAVESIHPVAFDHGDTRNLLAASSSGDLLVFLTQDAIPSSPDWLATLAANFRDPAVGAAYCRNVPRPDAHILTRVFSENDPGYAAARREVRISDPAAYAAMSPHERRLFYNFNDVASAIRRDLWELHPFPRAAFGEDVLMARALLEAGYTVVYDAAATVEHSHDYGPDEMKRRAEIDGRFNAEWIGRVCVASRADAETLVKLQLARDRGALEAAGIRGEPLARELARAEELRRAAFVGLFEGGLSKLRRPSTRMRERATLKILYVVHGFPPDTWAGTEVYTLGLALEMRRRGHDVAILARAPAALEESQGGPAEFSLAPGEFRGLPVWRMTHRLRHTRLRDSYHQPRAEAAFRDALLRIRPDVVHFQHLLHFSAGLPHVAREYGVPSIVTVNDYWALCARVQLIRPDGVRCDENQGLGCWLCVKDKDYTQIARARQVLPLGSPFAALLSAAAKVPALAPLAHLAQEYDDIAARHEFATGGYAACDLAIAPSRFLRGKLLDTGRFDAHRVLYSDYGTLTDNVRPLARAPDPQGRVRFGFVGSLIWYKGVDVLVRAMGQLAGTKAVLHVFGDFRPEADAHHSELARLARETGGAVEFHGRFDNARIAEVYEGIDVLVVPSVWFENSPITIHESFLFRTPLVVSDIGGMAELVRDGVDGLHFRVGDARDLARVLRRFVDEPDLVARLSRQWPRIKTMAEDAREMEVRYRALACVERSRGARTYLDARGIHTLRREGPVEQQGADLLLLRPGGAAVEYDVSLAGAGRVEVRLEVLLLGAEREVPMAASVALDGRELGSVGPFAADGRDEVRAFAFEAELESAPRRLRIEPRASPGAPEQFLRIARVVVADAPPRRLDALASKVGS